METTAIDADDNPCVLEERVVLLKELDVLVARLGHGGNGSVEADKQDRADTAGQCLGWEDVWEIPEQDAKKRKGKRLKPPEGRRDSNADENANPRLAAPMRSPGRRSAKKSTDSYVNTHLDIM